MDSLPLAVPQPFDGCINTRKRRTRSPRRWSILLNNVNILAGQAWTSLRFWTIVFNILPAMMEYREQISYRNFDLGYTIHFDNSNRECSDTFICSIIEIILQLYFTCIGHIWWRIADVSFSTKINNLIDLECEYVADSNTKLNNHCLQVILISLLSHDFYKSLHRIKVGTKPRQCNVLSHNK